MIFNTKVAGIPCQCKVTNYTPPIPMMVYGPGMADADPPEDSEFDFTLLDSKGYPAPWLEKKLTPQDVERLEEEHVIELKAQEYFEFKEHY